MPSSQDTGFGATVKRVEGRGVPLVFWMPGLLDMKVMEGEEGRPKGVNAGEDERRKCQKGKQGLHLQCSLPRASLQTPLEADDDLGKRSLARSKGTCPPR